MSIERASNASRRRRLRASRGTPRGRSSTPHYRAVEVAKGRERHLARQVEKLEERLLETDLAVAEGEREIGRLADLVDEIQHTRSWRWTAPFRFVRRVLPF